MTLNLKINIWTEALLACSVACLVLILPSIVSDELMNGTQSGKFFFFTYSLLGILMLWSVGLLFKKELNFHFTIIDLLLALFVGWVSLNKFLLHDVHAFSLRYFELVGLFVLYIIVRSVDRKHYTLFLVAICIAGLVQAVYGNLQLWGYYPSHHGLFKMTGSFFNPGPFAGFLCCVLPVAVGLYWGHKDDKLQVTSLKAKLFEWFEVSRLKSLTAKPFEKIKHQASSDQTIYEENYQTRSEAKSQTQSIEREVSNVSNIFEQLSFISIKYTALFTIIAILLVLPAARSRAAWLGAIAGVIYLALHKYHLNSLLRYLITGRIKSPLGKRSSALANLGVNTRKIVIVLLPALVLLAGSLSLYHYKKDSADGRMLIWTVTANIIKDYPLLGVGQDLFKAHYMDYQADYFRNHPNSKYEQVADDNQYAFNEFLNTWAENGLIGFLLLMGIVVAIFFSVLNHKEHEGIINHEGHKDHEEKYEVGESQLAIVNLQPETITKASILAILVFGMFAYPSEILPIKIVAVICLGVLANYNALNLSNFQSRSVKREASNISNSEALKPSNIQTLFKLTLTGLTLMLTIGAYSKTNELRLAYKTWNDAFDLYNYGLYSECLEDYQKAYPLLQRNGEFLVNYGKALSIAEKHTDAIKILGQAKNYQSNTVLCTAFGDSQKALKQYTDAEKNYWQASEMTLGKFYPQYLLAKLYDETGQQQKAVDMATSLLKKEVKVESTAMEEIHDEMKKIIGRNAEGNSLLIENTTNGQKGRNNQTTPQKYSMVTLPAALSDNQYSTKSGIDKAERRWQAKKRI